MKKEGRFDIPLIIGSAVILFGSVLCLLIFPEGSKAAINAAFAFCTGTMGAPVQICNVAIIIGAFYIVFSKYGNIRLGETKPKYSVFSWVGMIFTAGLGCAVIYWGSIEWAFHYNSAPLVNPAGMMSEAVRYEWAFAYHWLHWGPFAEPIYTACAVTCGYLFYNKKKTPVLSYGDTLAYYAGRPGSKIISKIVDIVFLFSVISSCAITIGFGLPIIRYAAGYVFNFQPSQAFYYGMIFTVAFVYYISSYIGIDKGLRHMSDWNVYGVILIGLFTLFAGPTRFILDGYLSGISLVLNHFPRMLLWLDPIGASQFPQNWSVWNWLYMASFGPFTGVFLARISEGRTLRGTILAVVLGCPIGFFFFNGIMFWYGIYLDVHNIVDVTAMVAADQSFEAVIEIFKTLPFSKIIVSILAIIGILFLATTVDSSTYTAANIVEPRRPKGTDPSPLHRLVWSVAVTMIPLACFFIGADITVFKSLGIVVALPILISEAFLFIRLILQLKGEYGDLSVSEIIEAHRLKLPEEKPAEPAAEPEPREING